MKQSLQKTAAVLLRRLLERLVYVDPCRQPRRCDAEKNTGTCGHQTGRAKDTPIHADHIDPRKLAQVKLVQGNDAAPGEEDSQGGGHSSQRKTFNQQLTGDAQPSGADGHANAEFATSGEGAGKQQVPDVGRGDHQQCSHHCLQAPKCLFKRGTDSSPSIDLKLPSLIWLMELL